MIAVELRPPLDDILDHSNAFHNASPGTVRDRYNTPRDFYNDEIRLKTEALRNALDAWEFFAKSQDRIGMTYKDYTYESVYEQLSFLYSSIRVLIINRIRIGGEKMSIGLKNDLAKAYEIISRKGILSEETTPLNSGMITLEPEEIQAGIMDRIDPKILILGAGAAALFFIIYSKA